MLPEIHSAKEAVIIQNFLSNVDPISVNSYWIGLKYNGTQNTFIWETSNNTVNYFDWNEGEPNEKPNECNVIEGKIWKWNDVSCTSKFYALCQWPTPVIGIQILMYANP